MEISKTKRDLSAGVSAETPPKTPRIISIARERNDIPGFGADQDEVNRPGIPMEDNLNKLPGAHWNKPDKQPQTTRVFMRVGLEEMTPVFGTCQPARGLSGKIKRAAYKIPEDKAAHWGLLLFSDRVDVVEGQIKDAFTRKPFLGLIALGGLSLATYFYINQSKKRHGLT